MSSGRAARALDHGAISPALMVESGDALLNTKVKAHALESLHAQEEETTAQNVLSNKTLSRRFRVPSTTLKHHANP